LPARRTAGKLLVTNSELDRLLEESAEDKPKNLAAID